MASSAALPQWAVCGPQHFPAWPIPTPPKERAPRPQAMAPVGLHAPAWAQVPPPGRPQIALGLALLAAAMPHHRPLRLRVFARWSRAAELVALARARPKDGIRWRHKPRPLAPHRSLLQAAPAPGPGLLSLWKRWAR